MSIYAKEHRYPYIRICENGFPDRGSASGSEFELMSQGQILLIAPSEVNTRKQDMTYRQASALNHLAARITTLFNTRNTPK